MMPKTWPSKFKLKFRLWVLLVSHRDQAGLHGVLVVLGVVPEGVQQLLGLQLAGADQVDGGEEGELVLQALGGGSDG